MSPYRSSVRSWCVLLSSLPPRYDFCRQVFNESVYKEVKVIEGGCSCQLPYPSGLLWCGGPHRRLLLLWLLNRHRLRLGNCYGISLSPIFLPVLSTPFGWILRHDLWKGGSGFPSRFKGSTCVFLILVVSGSDSGIGHALAKYLDNLGFVVFAGVLNKKGAGAEELKRSCSQRLCVLQLDITNSGNYIYLTFFGSRDSVTAVYISFSSSGLWGVVNNAGILGFPADGELLPMSVYKQCMDVNFFGHVEVTKMFLPLLRKSKGRLINISSMAGGIPMTRFAAYGASKAALSMFSGVLYFVIPGIQGTSELWAKQEKHLLENLTPDVKKDYGEDYIEALKNFLLHMPVHCAPDLSPVLDDVLNALLAKSPHGLYTPGKSAYLALCTFCYFPLWLYDLYIVGGQLGGGLPRPTISDGDGGQGTSISPAPAPAAGALGFCHPVADFFPGPPSWPGPQPVAPVINPPLLTDVCPTCS
uniref:Hydroxysteroid 17-beta dehydrogenase 2 n=1 Tax=Chrysemys picta bellii TaxID=8478 RepID=A0A8C3II49_CHRPI